MDAAAQFALLVIHATVNPSPCGPDVPRLFAKPPSQPYVPSLFHVNPFLKVKRAAADTAVLRRLDTRQALYVR